MTAPSRAEFRGGSPAVDRWSALRLRTSRFAERSVSRLTTSQIRVLGAAVSSVGFVLAVLAAASTNAWTSDDVFVQNVLRSIQATGTFAPVVGGDNFALKTPVYLLVGALLPNGAQALTITTLVVDAPLVFALIFVADRAAAPRGRGALAAAHLLVAWFLVSRIAPMSSLMIPNGRNGEIGVAVLLLAWWAGPLRGRLDLPARIAGGAALALLFFSDGFFVYVLVGAAGLVAAAAWVLRLPYARRAGSIALGTAGAAGVALLLGRLAKAAGLEVLQNYVNAVPAAGDVPAYVATAIGALARNLNGDATGRPLGAAAVPALLQVLLLLVVLVLAAAAAMEGRALRDLRVALGLAVVLVNVVLYVVTSNASDPYSFRYVLFATVVLLLLAASGVGRPRRTSPPRSRVVRVLAVVGVAAVVLGLGMNGRTVARAASGGLPDPQARTAQIIAVAEQHGLRVGVGDYWDGNITTYFSQGRVRVVPQDCTSGRMATRAWLINKPETSLARQAEFVVVRSAVGCTSAVVLRTFGKPVERVALPESGDAVWIYGRRLG